MLFWNSLAFSMIQRMLAIWSLVPVPFLGPAWTPGNSQFMNCWSLAWRIVSITLLGVRWVQVCGSLNKPSPRVLTNCPKPALLFLDCSFLSLQLFPSRIRWLFEPAFWNSGKGTQTGVCAQEPHGVLLGFIFTFLASTQEGRVAPILSYLQHFSFYIPVGLASIGTLTVF